MAFYEILIFINTSKTTFWNHIKPY